MINGGTIVLDGLDAAHFVASASFHEETHLEFPKKSGLIEISEEDSKTWDEGNIVEDRTGQTPRYLGMKTFYKSKEDWYRNMLPYQLARMRYIYRYLIKHYPNADYAEQFAVSAEWGCNSYWARELSISYEDIVNY